MPSLLGQPRRYLKDLNAALPRDCSYLYVSNTPTTYTDPSGLEFEYTGPTAPPLVGGSPQQISNASNQILEIMLGQNFGVPDRNTLTRPYVMPIPPTTPGQKLTGGRRWRAEQSHHIIVSQSQLAANDVVGTDGAGPCIGVIIFERRGPNGLIMAAHFDGSNNATQTMYQFLHWYAMGRPVVQDRLELDPIIYVFGGNNLVASNVQLRAVIRQVEGSRNCKLNMKYINTSGLYIDQNGQIYVFQGQGPNKDEYDR